MKKLTITIGIPAYNEENNIQTLFESIHSQRSKSFLIREIIVLSDGCTDSTVSKVHGLNDPRIKIIEGQKRIGKSRRLNQLFRIATGDIICLLDADTKIGSDFSMEAISKVFLRDKQVALVSARPKPFPPRTFIEKSINVSREGYDRAKEKMHKGNNVMFSCGKMLAIRSSLAREITIPSSITADDAYLYFYCISKGYKFVSTKSAVILFYSPTTIKDQVIQNSRYLAQANQVELFKTFFGSIVDKEFTLSRSLLYRSLFKQFMQAPLESIVIISINSLIKIWTRLHKNKGNSLWQIALSTKGLVHG
jgi:cellulose synthase/poly-beta-1,6-N-acetylglucosamine synthase-like glycosyltransferase